ncbi:hypothetical protein ABZ131_20665 [Providencia rettgeri]
MTRRKNEFDVYPVYTGDDWKRKCVSYEKWLTWCKEFQAYGFRVAPYPVNAVVVVGDQRYLETIKAMYGINYINSGAENCGGFVTYFGLVESHSSLLTVMLQDDTDDEIIWHEALHVALMTCEYVGISPREQEAITYLQGYIAEHLKMAFAEYHYRRKAKTLIPLANMFTGDIKNLKEVDALSGSNRRRVNGRHY